MKEQVAEKHHEFREKMRVLEDQLEIEQENSIKLERVQNQRDNFQKVITGLQESVEQYKELQIELTAKNDKIKQMEKEVAATEELQQVVSLLRNDLSEAR